jgi:MatE
MSGKFMLGQRTTESEGGAGDEAVLSAFLPAVATREPREREPHGHGALLRDCLGYLLSKGVPGFFGLISVPIFVSLIGIEEYGRLAVILPVLMALGGAGSGWLQQGILRFHPATGPGSPSDSKSASESAFDRGSAFDRAVRLGTVWAVLGLGLSLLPILGALRYRLSVCGMVEIYGALQLIYMVSLTRLQAQLQPRAVLRKEALRSCAGFVLPVVLILGLGQRSFSLVILGLAFGYLLPLLTPRRRLALSPAERAERFSSRPEANRILAELWRYGWAVGAWLMLCQALPVVGRSAIQRYSGYAQAGIYASLYEIAVRSLSLFASPVMQAAHPRIMRSWNAGDYGAARRTIRQSILIQTLMFLPLEAAGLIFARPIIRLILGTGDPAGNPAAGSLFPVLMLGGFLWQIALLVHKPLEIMRRTKTMLCGMVGVVLIEMAGNYVLVPRFGMRSAGYVFLGGALAYVAFAAVCSRTLLYRPDDRLAAASA